MRPILVSRELDIPEGGKFLDTLLILVNLFSNLKSENKNLI